MCAVGHPGVDLDFTERTWRCDSFENKIQAVNMTEITKTFRRTTYSTISPSSGANDQSGRTVLITGGSEGIGYNTALAFAEAHASKIIIVSRSQSKLDQAYSKINREHPNADVEVRSCDVSDIAQIQDLWSQLANNDIFIDVLVLGASATDHPNNLEEQISIISFNIIANLHMLENFKNQENPTRKQKMLIYLSSATLHCYPYPALTYAATKAGFSNDLCRMADSIPETEMRIIIYHPGAVYTAAAERASEVPKDLPIWDDPSLSAHMAVWLASRDAAFLHGRFIWANWDADELMQMKDKISADPGFLKIGVTGVGSFQVKNLMEVCDRFPLRKG